MKPSAPRAFRRIAVTLGALALGLGTLVGASSSATASPPEPVRPVVGDCHTVTYKESFGVAEPDPVVTCSAKHTSRTIHVSDLPSSVDLTSYDEVAKVVDKRCDPAYAKAVGGTFKRRYQTAFGILFFLPTDAQQAQGARWLRCDVVLYAGKRLANLPSDSEPAIGKGNIPDNVAKCRVILAKDYYTTACSSAHVTRVKGLYTIPGKKYPSEQAHARAAKKKCPKLTGSKTKWLSFAPSEAAWKSGFRIYTCDLITKH